MPGPAIDRTRPTPIKEQLRQWVLRGIGSGELPTGGPIPSINRLARELGIGRETVRLGLDSLVDRGVLVPEQGKGYFVTERRVRAHRVALLAKVDGVYVRPIYEGLTGVLGTKASVMLIDNSVPGRVTRTVVENLAYNLSVDRLLVVPPRGREKATQRALASFRRYFKVGWMDRAPGETRDATFLCDYARCVELALEHLASLGLERILYFSRQREDRSVFSAMRRTFRRSGVKRKVVGNWRDVLAAARRGPLGVMAETDSEAVFLQSRLLGSGVQVPRGAAIVSCDNTGLTDLVSPEITSVSPGFRELGRAAARWILSEKTGDAPRFTAAPVLALRASTRDDRG
ncbi:MAG: substrate-binding domain-containing protein [Planctomycetota bacterium]|jgi:DNA-binding LacI/PurR family transcriptional regulator